MIDWTSTKGKMLASVDIKVGLYGFDLHWLHMKGFSSQTLQMRHS